MVECSDVGAGLLIVDTINQCSDVGAGLLIVDTINQFAGFQREDENHSGPVLEAMQPLQHAAGDGLAVVMGRHERKAGGRVGKSGRGSTAFTGAADIELLLQRPAGNAKSTVREIHALSRFDVTPALLVIEKTDEGVVAHGTRTDIQAKQVREAILEALSTETLDLSALIARLPTDCHGRTTVQNALAELIDSGEVAKTGQGVKGSPFVYCRS